MSGTGPGSAPLAPAEGRLLVATAVIDEPTFFRTVILLLEHDDAVGTLGVVLNRPTDLTIGETIPSWQSAVSAPGVLFTGGPVAEGSALGLGLVAAEDSLPDGTTGLFGRLAIVDLESDATVMGSQLEELRIYSGYAGWGAGQLAGELRSKAWWVFDSLPADWFATDPSDLWSEVLRRQGGRYKMWASAPVDPAVN